MKTHNFSRQRQAIMDFLYTRKDHPTAEVIYKGVREVYPNISLGTVYRNLNLLADERIIRRVKGLNGSEHFDADTSDHQHFLCRKCGCVSDLYLKDTGFIDSLMESAASDFRGQIFASDIYFWGTCEDCMNLGG